MYLFNVLEKLWQTGRVSLVFTSSDDLMSHSAHHFVAIFGYIVGRYAGISTFAMIIFQSNEISTPIYHIRYFLTQWDLRETQFYKINQIVFAVLFLISRVLLNSFVLFATLRGLTYREVPSSAFVKYNQLFNCVAFCVLQYIWFGLILSVGLKKKNKKA